MRTSKALFVTALFVGLLTLVSCGKDEPAAATAGRESAKAPAAFRETVGALAPANAPVVVQFASAERLSKVAGALARAFGAPDPGDPLAQMVGPVGVDPARVARDKPLAIAVSMDKQAPMPMPTLILPLASGAESLAQGGRTRDGYAAVPMGAPAKEDGSQLPAGLLAGDVSARVDLAAIVRMYRAEIDQGLGMAEGMMRQGMDAARASSSPVDMAKAMQGYLDSWASGVRKLVDSAETLDVAATRLDDGGIDLDVVLSARAGSALDAGEITRPGLRSLAAYLPEGFPAVLLMRFSWSDYMKMFGGMFDALAEAMPEEQRASYRSMMEKSTGLLQGFGDEWMIALDVNAGGMRAVMVARAPDGEDLVQRYVEFLQDPMLADMGMQFEDLGIHEVAGVDAHRGRMSIDVEKYLQATGVEGLAGAPSPAEMRALVGGLLGGEGLEFDLAATDDGLVVFAMGGGGAAGGGLLGRALTAGRAPDSLAPTLARAGGELNFALYLDLRSSLKGLADLMLKMDEPAPQIMAGAPLPVSLACTTDGRVHRFGASFNPEAIAAFFKRIDQSMRNR